MKILLVHNRYMQAGGEDVVFAAERDLLRRHGHRVSTLLDHNDRIAGMGRLRLAAKTFWSREWTARLRDRVRRERPDVVHFHNTFPLISPAAYRACRAEGVPVVQLLSNYRLLCPAANLVREGRVCEDCVGRSLPWPAVAHGCYRDSRAASAVTAGMIAFHRALGTWTRDVDAYIALTEFGRDKLADGGLPPGKIHVKPNFVHPDPGPGTHTGGYALFVGRLSEEKGVGTLIDAWRRHRSAVPLKMVGTGPLEHLARRSTPAVEWLGWTPKEQVLKLMQEAAFLVLPSDCYEGFPMTLAEAFATGLPVVASRHGAMAEIVDHGRTGLHFRPGDPDALARRVDWAAEHPREVAAMGRRARREFEDKYTAAEVHRRLMAIYHDVTESGAHGNKCF